MAENGYEGELQELTTSLYKPVSISAFYPKYSEIKLERNLTFENKDPLDYDIYGNEIIKRVSEFMGREALRQGYFDEKRAKILRDEMIAITLNQLGVFNSPVWFNAGIQKYSNIAGRS